MRGVFVVGTDTGVGKSVLAAAIATALRRRGERVVAYKPVLTGTDESPGEWPADDELLHAAAGDAAVPYRFGPPVSPHLAAELAGTRIDFDRLVSEARRAGAGATLVAEGVGGLLVPLDGTHDVRDLVRALDLPVVIAARPGLGTINHTLLTLEAAAGLDVRAVVLTPWPPRPSVMERSNRETIERRGRVAVATLSRLAPDDLTAELPLDDWIGSAQRGSGAHELGVA